MFVLGSNTTGIGVFLLTLSWYFDRRETSPTLVCISPNRIPVKISNSGLEWVAPCEGNTLLTAAGITG